ncbi:MAG: mechanosensitive ion channel family protein [Cyanobacterium sp. T60_A2020_053]|nr:mechanosensitive ion channel family protein [Cyanobacterium sp. T60_A2020_053]
MQKLLNTISESLMELVGDFIKILPGIISGVIILFLTRYFANWGKNFSLSMAQKVIKNKSLEILFIQGISVGIWVVGFFLACVLAFPGLNLGTIFGALGLSSIAIGFAFQDIFKNFLAGILILLQEPFRIGDEIIVEGYQGLIEHIDIRTTIIRTYQGEKVLIPNATIFTNSVQVRTGYDKRRTDLAVGVDYNTPLPQTKELLLKIVTGVDGVLVQPAPEIDLVNFGDSSIDFVVRYWTLPQQKIVRKVQTTAIMAIKNVFDEAGISIPYPIRSVYFYDQEKFNEYQMSVDEKVES